MSNFDVFVNLQFLGAVQWRWTCRYGHLAMVTLVSPFKSQQHWHCLTMPIAASLTLSRSARGPGPSTNIQSISSAQQSTVGCWTAINSVFECSWSGAYHVITKTYSNINNYLTITIYKWLIGSGTLFFTDAFTKQYRGVRHFFDFSCLTYDKRRRYEKMSWKTYFNFLMKRKGKIFGEELWFRLMVKFLVNLGKIFIRIIINFNAFTINIPKQFIECLVMVKTQGTGKTNALPSLPNHLQSSWPAVPLCYPTIFL